MPASPTEGVPRPAHPTPHALSSLGGALHGADIDVTGITAASDLVRPGDLFAALPGRMTHGAAFAADAVHAGAVAVLTDDAGSSFVPAGTPYVTVGAVRPVLGPVAAQLYGHPSARLRMLGITGTSGKTTTTFLMRAALQAAGRATGLIGTVATLIGQEQVSSRFTTPEAPEIQSLLAVMHERGVRDVAMEVSSHALRMGRVEGIGFDVSAFTNLSEDHLDFHTDMADYFAAKASLFDARTERAVVVVDDEWGRRLAGLLDDPITVSTGTTGAAWHVDEVVEQVDGTTAFRVRGPGVDLRSGCAIPGRYNVANAVLALAVLDAAGVDVELAAHAVSTASVPGRMERIDAGQPFLAVVDYSHKPAAVDGALRALRPLTQGRLIVVLGCGGDRDRGKRPHMGEIAARGADLLVVTDDNPRSEDPATIRAAMLTGTRAVPSAQRSEVIEIGDRAEAIAHAVSLALPGDTVLVAGKGHETGQEVAGVVHPFDDRDVLRGLLHDLPRGAPMIALTLAEIAEIVDGTLTGAAPETAVTGSVEFDSRRIGPGGLFLALPGEDADGHDFAARATAAGAVATLATHAVDGPAITVHDGFAALAALASAVLRRLPDVTVIGVTGSSGKTSTKDLLAQLLARLGPTVAPPGSFNNELGHPYTVLRADADTRYLVLENSARGIGHIAYLTRIAPPRIGVVLNVGSAHLGEFGSREAIAQAKGELIEALPADGLAVLNADDPLVAAMASRTRARLVTVGRSVEADIRATDVSLDDGGHPAFTLHANGDDVPVRLRLVGEHHVGNSLSAAAVALELGMSPGDVAEALGAATATSRWRMEVTERADGVLVVNDAYNANPESMGAALHTLADLGRARRSGGGQTFAVLGPMGELGPDSEAEHEAVGRLAAQLDIARLIAIGDAALPIQRAAALAGSSRAGSSWVPDVDAAAALLRSELRPGDVVLVKASRAASLERLAQAIIEDGPVSGAAAGDLTDGGGAA